MYLRYFGFDSAPFAVTPDPAFLYLSQSHREALGHLLYGADARGGFVALTGEVGTGKTTLIRAVVENNAPDLDIALCWNPHLDTTEFVATVCDELDVNYDPARDTTLKVLVDRLNAHLLDVHAANRRTVLIIDEAQNLSRDVLEQLRLLTNLETHKDKLLRVILVGQPELAEVLARHDLRQLAQRITARFTLKPLGLAETGAYVRHRLKRANGPQNLFSRPGIWVLRACTRGVPRLINLACERALMGAYAHGRTYVGPWTIARAAAETLPARPRRARRGRWWRLALPIGAFVGVALVASLAWLPEITLTSAAEGPQAGHANPRASRKTPTSRPHAADTGADARPAKATTASNNTGPEPNTGVADRVDAQGNDQATASGSEKKQPAISGNRQTAADAADTAPKAGEDNKTPVSRTIVKAPAQTLPKGNADMNQLLRLWGVFGAEVRAGCNSLHVGDLRCLADRGTLEVLEHYDRPALLVLKHNGHRQTILLSAVNKKKDTATVVGGNGTRDIDQARLQKLWTGRFEMIWRSEAGIRLIQPGSVGSGVVWLRKRLQKIDGKNPASLVGKPSPVYDDALGDRLKAFQKTHGLTPDGLAGPRTQIVLNGAVPSPGTPSLRIDQTSEP